MGLLLLNLGNTTISIGTLLLIILLLGRAREHDEDFPAEGIGYVHAENLTLELLMAYRLKPKRKQIKFKIDPKEQAFQSKIGGQIRLRSSYGSR